METEEEFFEAVKEEFGDKVQVFALDFDQEVLDMINAERNCNLTKEDFLNYGKQAWLMDDKCPVCGEELNGILGTFEWGIAHGIGHCSNCRKVEFRYYHYIGDPQQRILGYSVVGF